ncbi:glycosyltransferase family 4 protein [Tianweitania sediminis]|uniref:Glycosyltransferase family 4 protein n=1 Tax=Tianweitania sediminis TaxID=1502156 RepID=A0A8J7UJ75_9HYPH|nr:glycosyltransferase family 4 protein [Tianweitania sediminis]MBP0438570.1 glycosyltransferase family 4 protein [Tianweitania sediminis]
MHILFLSDNFVPEVNAPASRTYEHCREWVAAGHQVTVITGVPNFPRGIVYPGYRNKLWQSETISGIRVVRVGTLIFANEGFLWRTLDYLSFMLSAAIAACFVRRVDVVVGTSPQFFTACAAWLVGAVRRLHFVMEVRDLWPESIRAVGAMKSTWLLALMEKVELFLYRRAALIVTVTRATKRILAARGIDADKITVVTNGADLRRFQPMPKDPQLSAQMRLSDTFVVGYIGTHGLAHGLDALIDTARLLRERGANDIRILMLGDGAEKRTLQARAADEGLSNLLFLDSVPKDQVARFWSLLDLSVIHLRRDPLFEAVIPSKLFEAMAMGIPTLLGVRGEAADIVARHGVGLPVPPEDPAALAAAILALKNDPQGRARMRVNCTAAIRNYTRPVLARLMLLAIEAAVPSRRAAQEIVLP